MDYLRQQEIFDPAEYNGEVTLIGSGGVGSFSAVALAKLGIKKLVVYDFDKVEEHNLPNQFFTVNAVGKPKVEELAKICQLVSDDVTVEGKNEKFVDQQLSGIVICGVDSMEQRKIIWDKVKMNFNVRHFIDIRIGGEQIRAFSVPNVDIEAIEKYEATLYDDSKAAQPACTSRAVIDVGFGIGAIVARFVRGILKNDDSVMNLQLVMDMKTLSIIKI